MRLAPKISTRASLGSGKGFLSTSAAATIRTEVFQVWEWPWQFLTLSCAWYLPGAEKLCFATAPAAVCPSPKSQVNDTSGSSVAVEPSKVTGLSTAVRQGVAF